LRVYKAWKKVEIILSLLRKSAPNFNFGTQCDDMRLNYKRFILRSKFQSAFR